MKFRLIVLSLALVAAACGDSSQVVATVNGSEITAHYMASLRQSYSSVLNVNTEQFRNDLSQNVIVLVALRQLAESDFGITVSDEEIAQRLTDPPPRWQALIDQLAADADTTDVFAAAQAELSILRDRVTAELIRREPGFIEGTLAEAPQDLTAGCLRHILVASEPEAAAAITRISTGEDFVAVAEEITLDTVGGGLVGGCPVSFGGFVPPFALAATRGPLNEPIGPVETEFGFHVILVEQRTGPPSLDELTSDPIRYFPGSMLSGIFTPWFNGAVRDAEVTVAPAVGTWSTAGLGIVAPGQ